VLASGGDVLSYRGDLDLSIGNPASDLAHQSQ
jgi:hypothetical protein